MTMKKIETIATGVQFAAAAFGKMEELGDYLFEAGPGIRIPGKVFGGAALGTTGCEFSLQRFLPGTETGFLHTHRRHEELYFVLSGSGEFQVDGTVFPVTEGCVVRVSPAGRRSVRNNGSEPLAVLCVQYAADSFGPDDAADGELLLGEPVVW